MGDQGSNLIHQYFPQAGELQLRSFDLMEGLYREWNSKINVVSRKDIDKLFLHHILHSLAIARLHPFSQGDEVLDVGTGGGFPGIPLAIMYPGVSFTLMDSIGKKIRVVNEVASALGLNNVRAMNMRVETHHEQYDFVVSRAVSSLPVFVGCAWKNVAVHKNRSFPGGILYLKGGDIREEIAALKQQVRLFPIREMFNDSFFEEKYIVHIFHAASALAR